MKQFWLLLVVMCAVITEANGQQDFNKFDEKGRRHGIWRKYFNESDQLRYEGRFEHGKEVGTFKFYCPDCKDQPVVIKEFQEQDMLADVQFYTPGGILASKGVMKGKNRVGEWLFYHKDGASVMSREYYSNGVLHGNKITYYPNGVKTEEVTYQFGRLEGNAFYYSPQGVVLKELYYNNDQLHGPATYYDAHGNIVIQGHYKRGAKDGLWQYFENGSKVMEETFPKQKD